MSKFEELKNKIESEIEYSSYSAIEDRVNKVILVSSGLAAGVAVQPLPFADFPILTTIEIIMVKKIGEEYGYSFSFEKSQEILIELFSVIGMGWLARNLILTGYKTIIPFAGGFFTIPLVFGSCYGIGKVAEYYYKCIKNNMIFDSKSAKNIFEKSKLEGQKLGKNKHFSNKVDKDEIYK